MSLSYKSSNRYGEGRQGVGLVKVALRGGVDSGHIPVNVLGEKELRVEK